MINKLTGKAMHDYRMISKGDKVLVAVSGQDSLSLLDVLQQKLSYFPIKYTLIGAHINVNNANATIIKDFLEERDIKYYILPLDLNKNRKDIDKTQCFWCSWKRREALFKLATRIGCRKIAFAHHMDDIIESLLLNMLFHGEISTMPPKLKMFNGRFYIIRPFAYIQKKYIKEYASLKKIPSMPYECPIGKTTNRMLVRRLLDRLEKEDPRIKKNIFNSMTNIVKNYLPDKPCNAKLV